MKPHRRGLKLKHEGSGRASYWVVLNSDGYAVAQGSKELCERAMQERPGRLPATTVPKKPGKAPCKAPASRKAQPKKKGKRK